MHAPRTWLTVAALAAATLTALPARAQDPFEIEVYQAETTKPGHWAMQWHFNNVIRGSTATSPDGARPTDHVSHLTLETIVGACDGCEAALYLQSAIHPDGTIAFGGAKLRFMAAFPERFAGIVGLGVNMELGWLPSAYEPDQWGIELRPILDVVVGGFFFAFNPIVGFSLKGRDAGHPSLEPAAKVGYWLFEPFGLELEYISSVGVIDRIPALAEQSHRMFLTALVHLESGGTGFELTPGLGYGFTGDDRWTFKFMAEIDF